MKKFQIILKFSIAVLLNLTVFSALTYYIVSEIKLENASINANKSLTVLEKDEKNPSTLLMLDFFYNLQNGKTDLALETVEKIAFSKDFPQRQKLYFTDFYEFYNAIQNKKLKNCQIETQTFIKNSSIIKDYFAGTKYQYESLNFIQIVPYFLIQNYNYSLKKQEKLYKMYLDVLCESNNYLSEKASDIVCLYIQERYTLHPKNDISLKQTLMEIQHFTQTFPLQLGDKGIFRTQALYLQEVSAFLNAKINSIGNFSGIFPKYNF